MKTKPLFDVVKLSQDLADRGWLPTDLARVAEVSDMTVTRVLRGQRHNPRTWAKLAAALGKTTRRYVIREEKAA